MAGSRPRGTRCTGATKRGSSWLLLARGKSKFWRAQLPHARQIWSVTQEDALSGDPPSIHYPKLASDREVLDREFWAEEKDRKLIELSEFCRQSGKDDPSVEAAGVISPEQRAWVKSARGLNRILAAALRSRQESNANNRVEFREYLINVAHLSSMEFESLSR